nr:MAG TPA: hypothetical protein [Caudoviricetes sp.]
MLIFLYSQLNFEIAKFVNLLLLQNYFLHLYLI